MTFSKEIFDKARQSYDTQKSGDIVADTKLMGEILAALQGVSSSFKLCEEAGRFLGTVSAIRMAMGVGFDIGRRYAELEILEGMTQDVKNQAS